MSKELEDIFERISKSNNIAIAGHINPDGDTIGSCMALALCLNKIGKKPIVLLEDYNEKYDVIPGKEFLRQNLPDDLKVDIFVALDCSDKTRLGKFSELFDKTAVTISIDHHISNKEFAQYNYVLEGASSTSEIIFNMVNMYVPIDSDIATAIYAGIICDTGGFRHKSTNSNTHIVVSKLLNCGIPFTHICNELMFARSIEESRSFKTALENLVCLEDYGISYSYISQEDMERIGVSVKDFDGIVEYLINIRGTKVAFFAYPKAENEVKISFRSKDINVCEMAEKFNGGGHELAAGCNVLNTPILEVIDMVLNEVKKGM